MDKLFSLEEINLLIPATKAAREVAYLCQLRDVMRENERLQKALEEIAFNPQANLNPDIPEEGIVMDEADLYHRMGRIEAYKNIANFAKEALQPYKHPDKHWFDQHGGKRCNSCGNQIKESSPTQSFNNPCKDHGPVGFYPDAATIKMDVIKGAYIFN